jgi:ribose transport system substrate-binding protein
MQHQNQSGVRNVQKSWQRPGLRRVAALCCSMSLVATGLFTGMTATSASASTSKIIYVIGYQLNNAFWGTEGKGAQAAGKTFGVTVRYEAPETSSDAGMISLIDAALATHPYGIAIDYTDKTMQAPVLQALAQGTKVVLYNNNRFESQAGGATTNSTVTSLAYVGQDEHHSGNVLATEFLSFLPKGNGTVLIINPFAEAFVLTLRYNGVNSVLKAAGYNTDLLVVNGNDPEASVEATIGAYLQGHKNVVGVVGLGDPGASPATRYIEEHKLNMPVATFDIDTETYDLMKAAGSAEKVALDQQPYLQAYYAVEDLASEMLSGFQPVSVNTGTFLVTASNLDVLSKLVADGED